MVGAPGLDLVARGLVQDSQAPDGERRFKNSIEMIYISLTTPRGQCSRLRMSLERDGRELRISLVGRRSLD